MNEPRTVSGKRLLEVIAEHERLSLRGARVAEYVPAILAIEAEAATPAVSETGLRESVKWAIGWLDEAQQRHTVKNMRSAVAIAKANLRAALSNTDGTPLIGSEATDDQD